MQKLMTVGCLFAVFEVKNVQTRMGSPMCPPTRWRAKKAEVRYLRSGGGGSAVIPRLVSLASI